MSIQPNMERWKRRFLFLLAFAVGALLLTGATEITHELRDRPLQERHAAAQLRGWGVDLARDVAPARRVEWEHRAEAAPQMLIRACTRPE